MVAIPVLDGNAAALPDEKLTGRGGEGVPEANAFEADPRNELELNVGKTKLEVPNNPFDDKAEGPKPDAELDGENGDKAAVPYAAVRALDEIKPALED